MRRTLLFLALFLPLGASAAAADPVTITGGFLNAAGWEVVSPPSTATGTNGLRLITTLVIGPGMGNLAPFTFCDGTVACAPGTKLDVGGHLDAFDGGLTRVSLTLTGTEYEVDGLDYALQLNPTGTFTVPEFGSASEAVIKAPFTLTGFFADNILLTRTDLVGRGTATITLVKPTSPDFAAPGGWERGSIRYDFESQSVVPEPTSMLLLGTGLAGLVAGRARRRRAHAEAKKT